MRVLACNMRQIIPKFFLGGIFFYVGMDFVDAWIIQTYFQLRAVEYIAIPISVLGAALTSMTWYSVVTGMLAGIVVTVFRMLYELSVSVSSTDGCDDDGFHKRKFLSEQSKVCRLNFEKTVLKTHHAKIVVLRLTGVLFFGSVEGFVQLVSSILNTDSKNGGNFKDGEDATPDSPAIRVGRTSSVVGRSSLLNRNSILTRENVVMMQRQESAPAELRQCEYVILDFSASVSMDASVGDALKNLRSIVQSVGAVFIVCGLMPAQMDVLRRFGFFSPDVAEFYFPQSEMKSKFSWSTLSLAM